ncbi:DNA-processing protein DprA [Klebsiella oxytoca]|uniref:DNA-processing protein DprA n=1 Tax=Klebsiella oxytoca TaxID=571 RepID=UPI001CCF548C|nr:DNA-processing protein DprA [Klebsiella oxytoca]MBZ7632159.1 DNA-processing protein DprA [Klebsiella oxytoca]HEC2066531.1 DNA-protecting protein DprA [Klebsiella oxytoca]
MHPSEIKILLGLSLQVDRLVSEQGVFKLFNEIPFHKLSNEHELVEYINFTGFLKAPFTVSSLHKAEEYLNKHMSLGIVPIPFGDNKYPVCLAITPNPPAMLYVKGDVNILNEMPGVAIVGSRDVSAAGEEITKRITKKICEMGLVIVSGLAIGTDTNAHKATLNAKAKTIAVLAHGLEIAKPKQNARLANDILNNGGAWISEYPVGRPAFKQSFVQRNRIQVGLSAVSILIEAAKNSGTMTQADFAIKALRPIFAVVPHKPDNPLGLNCEGTQQLVDNEQAKPLRTSQDYDDLLAVISNSIDRIKINSDIYSTNVNNYLF